jgi:rhodanese-related sulfurtransferase
MKRIILSLTLATSLIPCVALACDGDGTHQAKAGAPVKATVAQVAEWTRAKKVTPVDANGSQTRTSQGIIPGAVLLTSSSQYDVKELPANKDTKLVFYCMNEKCGASHMAAQRAIENGYTDVAVLPDGITGWKRGGQPTAKPNNT